MVGTYSAGWILVEIFTPNTSYSGVGGRRAWIPGCNGQTVDARCHK